LPSAGAEVFRRLCLVFRSSTGAPRRLEVPVAATANRVTLVDSIWVVDDIGNQDVDRPRKVD
jgi:hypothetical protein